MNSKELAVRLAGATYDNFIRYDHVIHDTGMLNKKLIAEAKQNGLVIVYGASDDLMEFRGAIDHELGAYDGTTAYLTPRGLVQNYCNDDDCPYFERMKLSSPSIKAIWHEEGDYSWTFQTDIPHETFEITEDEKPYCRGIIFSLSDVK